MAFFVQKVKGQFYSSELITKVSYIFLEFLVEFMSTQ